MSYSDPAEWPILDQVSREAAETDIYSMCSSEGLRWKAIVGFQCLMRDSVMLGMKTTAALFLLCSPASSVKATGHNHICKVKGIIENASAPSTPWPAYTWKAV